MKPERGHLFIISAPSGAGKTTLVKAVLKQFTDMLYSISYTTRKPRAEEQDGVDYHFVSKQDFTKGIQKDRWAEWAEVYGNYYGTSAEFIENNLSSGYDILLDIDVQGTIQILKKFPESVTIFILPPSMETLRKRLEMRGSDSKTVIENRLLNAKKEMGQKKLYRHVIVNDKLSAAIEEINAVIKKYRQ
ncbi:MAG: guanylate kinase [Deltaproteobacteria bacterium]|jgi:guanylate kinase|nr:guanylate kinase [Deltaproteobacteria bacterium]